MLFNCLSCGKSISSKKNACAYCRCDITEIAHELSRGKRGFLQRNTIEKRTLLSFMAR